MCPKNVFDIFQEIKGKVPYGDVLSGYEGSNTFRTRESSHFIRELTLSINGTGRGALTFPSPTYFLVQNFLNTGYIFELMTSTWEITPESKTIPKLHNPILIEGLPGIGNVGKIAVDSLVEELKAVKLYSFFSRKFPHSVFINDKNLVEMPKIELYYVKFNGAKRDLLLLTGDIQPIDEESCYTFCEEIVAMATKFHCSEIMTTGGIGLQHPPDKPKVYCTGNDPALISQYAAPSLGVEKQIFGVVGPVVGVSGVLLGISKKRGIKGIALLAETFGHPLYLGIKGAQEILRILEKKFCWGMNLKKMSKEIVKVEKELMKKTKEWQAELVQATQAGARARQREVGYIG